MLDLYQKLDKIREIPALLPNSSIYSLDAYITSYDDCCSALGLPLTEQQKEFRLFLNWLRYEKYGNTTNKTIGWYSLILYDSDNEIDALHKFFELFDEFRALNNDREKSMTSSE